MKLFDYNINLITISRILTIIWFSYAIWGKENLTYFIIGSIMMLIFSVETLSDYMKSKRWIDLFFLVLFSFALVMDLSTVINIIK